MREVYAACLYVLFQLTQIPLLCIFPRYKQSRGLKYLALQCGLPLAKKASFFLSQVHVCLRRILKVPVCRPQTFFDSLCLRQERHVLRKGQFSALRGIFFVVGSKRTAGIQLYAMWLRSPRSPLFWTSGRVTFFM